MDMHYYGRERRTPALGGAETWPGRRRGALGGAWNLRGQCSQAQAIALPTSLHWASGDGREPTLGINRVLPLETPSLQLAPVPLLPHWEEARTQT